MEFSLQNMLFLVHKIQLTSDLTIHSLFHYILNSSKKQFTVNMILTRINQMMKKWSINYKYFTFSTREKERDEAKIDDSFLSLLTPAI